MTPLDINEIVAREMFVTWVDGDWEQYKRRRDWYCGNVSDKRKAKYRAHAQRLVGSLGKSEIYPVNLPRRQQWQGL